MSYYSIFIVFEIGTGFALLLDTNANNLSGNLILGSHLRHLIHKQH